MIGCVYILTNLDLLFFLKIDIKISSGLCCTVVFKFSDKGYKLQAIKKYFLCLFYLDIPPDFEILSSTFAAEWLETLRDGRHNDVTCVLQGREFSAHQVILCSASGFFCRLFKTGTVSGSLSCLTTYSSLKINEKKTRHYTSGFP